MRVVAKRNGVQAQCNSEDERLLYFKIVSRLSNKKDRIKNPVCVKTSTVSLAQSE